MRPSRHRSGFNPLPPPKRGETSARSRAYRCSTLFQSTPPAEARGDTADLANDAVTITFQSTPPAEARGDPRRAMTQPLPARFNPLPPPKRGETTSSRLCRAGGKWFQSTPPAEARGDPDISGESYLSNEVSIHSPRRSEGRPVRLGDRLRLVIMFQSTPPAEARGDTQPGTARTSRLSFNPLPPPKRGETRGYRHTPRRLGGFNPLPPPKRGETARLSP